MSAFSNHLSSKQPPQIADHVLIRCIGRGSYGEVWIARSLVGSLRAVKVVYRSTFEEDRPFQREFEGIQKFEPISRSHPGLVSILHVGRNIAGDYFYYVMELADDIRTGQAIDPVVYAPQTLRSSMTELGRFSKERSLSISLDLAEALSHLHAQGLIHRDIKPSNIIFLNKSPKFADIGLVTEVGEGATFVGTPGYYPPEGPGNFSGDVYSLGKVIYEIVMGKSCKDYPELPLPLEDFRRDPLLCEMNEIILKACHSDPKARFQNARELHEALLTRRKLSKPPGSLVAAASPSHLSASSLRPESAADESQPTEADRPVVCFIDDDRDELRIFQRVFGQDFQIVPATRFGEAMSRLGQLGRRPDMFVLDLYFPLGRDATDEERQTMRLLRADVEKAQRKLTEYLKSIGQDRDGGLRLMEQVNERFGSVPVVFYTRKGTTDDALACLDAGARDVIRKPQPEDFDSEADPYVQLEQAALAHRNSLLTRLESTLTSRSLIGKLKRMANSFLTRWRRR